jgi:radical SAM superfamily enzyme YgiQ (UPF0313 family)
MNIGLLDVDGHNFPNFALMKISAYHKAKGDTVEWANPLFGRYDRVYASKIFTFSPDIDYTGYNCEIVKGGTGYDITSTLPEEIEHSTLMDYSIYPQHKFSIQFFSRGCIRHCPFCLVHDKEGYIHSVPPVQLNDRGGWIEVLDNNFFANPDWHSAVDYLITKNLPVKLHGVDVRIMNEEQAYYLNKLHMKQNIHIAWDLPSVDLTDKLKSILKYIKPYKITCYVLIGFNSTVEQDLYRLRRLKELKITPFVQPFRDYENKRKPTSYENDLARWANRMWLFKSMDFADFSPRKGFKCKQYFN